MFETLQSNCVFYEEMLYNCHNVMKTKKQPVTLPEPSFHVVRPPLGLSSVQTCSNKFSDDPKGRLKIKNTKIKTLPTTHTHQPQHAQPLAVKLPKSHSKSGLHAKFIL